MEFDLSTSVTSVPTRMLIRPSLRTTGVKASDTPNGLKVMVGVQVWAPVVDVLQVGVDGIGSSPPARKFASSPETAPSVVSASGRDPPAISSAVRVQPPGAGRRTRRRTDGSFQSR